MTQEITFATGNKGKVMSMQRHITQLGIDAVIVQASIELTEIQADTATEVAQAKAKQAYEQIKKAVLVDDSSFHISALGGFPGPYIKYMLTTIGVEGIIDFMKDKADRSAYFLSSLVYIDNQGDEHIFNDLPYQGVITEAIDQYTSETAWGELYKIFIPIGSDKVLARMTSADHARVDKKQANSYEDFCHWIKTVNAP